MNRNRYRKGLTLLELVIATSMLAMVMAALSVILRNSRLVWEAHAADYVRIEAAHATLRHIVRQARQATEVVAISANTDDSGALSLRMADGTVVAWAHDDTDNTVDYGLTTANSLLATQIASLRFTGYEANGTTVTSVADLVRAILIEVTVQLPVESGGTRILTSWVWIRTW